LQDSQYFTAAGVFKFIKGEAERLAKAIIKYLHSEFLNHQPYHIILKCKDKSCCQRNPNRNSEPVDNAFYQVLFYPGAGVKCELVNDLSKYDRII